MICEYDPVTLELTMPEVYANWYGVPSVLKNIPYVVREFGILEEKNIPLYIEFYEAIQRGEKRALMIFISGVKIIPGIGNIMSLLPFSGMMVNQSRRYFR
ncbi:MAG TPA: hypothetical protein VJZ01_08930 [Lachnospiraceae bacterium]|nr:hypothetical protein [Lachnospiraceae bacterium]